ncbi:MAG: POTRA domain-containing protein [Terriglobales bacterium]
MFSPAKLRNSLFLIGGLLCAFGLVAQTPKSGAKELSDSANQLIAINVTGSKRYKPEDVAAATGLQIGQTVHEDDFRAAARLLADSGAFSDVAYRFSYSDAGTKVEFQVKDSPAFVPARFENFVWFSSKDLAQKLHAQVPLFHGELPVMGGLADQVSLALQALLIEAKVEGSADYTRVSGDGGTTQAFDFSVSGPDITIRNVQFPGADPSLLTLLQSAAEDLKGTEYSRTAIRTQAEKNFLRFYLQKGYLKATLGEPEATVVKSDPNVTQEETQVDVAFHPDPGPQYKLAGLTIAGNKVIATNVLRKLIQAQIGQPVNVVGLENDLTEMQHLYGTRGHMAAAIKSHREVDDKTLSVKYAVTIQEGDVYTMGDLDIHGLDSETTARMQTAWVLRSGDTYNSDYPKQFAEKEDRDLRDWIITIHESVNPKDRTVDVSLRFDPKG